MLSKIIGLVDRHVFASPFLNNPLLAIGAWSDNPASLQEPGKISESQWGWLRHYNVCVTLPFIEFRFRVSLHKNLFFQDASTWRSDLKMYVRGWWYGVGDFIAYRWYAIRNASKRQ